jgi:8-oxo-dGTP pyrophosphatase MutT (NUDIX family)
MKREQIIGILEPISRLKAWNHQQREDGLRDAAVLIPLIEREQWHVLLTKRTDHLHHHPGQVSFPGGRADKIDHSPLHTALRETEEEVGISADLIDIAGIIEPYLTVTDFNVIPIVGFVKPTFSLAIDEFEVAEVFEVPLSILAEPSNYQQKEIFWEGKNRQFWELMYNDYQIWGATASMLYAFASRLNGEKQS